MNINTNDFKTKHVCIIHSQTAQHHGQFYWSAKDHYGL